MRLLGILLLLFVGLGLVAQSVRLFVNRTLPPMPIILVEREEESDRVSSISPLAGTYARSTGDSGAREGGSLGEGGTLRDRRINLKSPPPLPVVQRVYTADTGVRSLVIESLAREYPLNVARLVQADWHGLAGMWESPSWYTPSWIPDSSPTCGEGSVVVVGHVSWYGRPGPFFELQQVEIGSLISCDGVDFVVTKIEQVDYNQDISYLWRQAQERDVPQLILYTCQRDLTGILMITGEMQGE